MPISPSQVTAIATSFVSHAVSGIAPGTEIDLGTLYVSPVDMNGNAIADMWETNYFGPDADIDGSDDPDADESSNYEEYLAGTVPTSSGHVLRIDRIMDTTNGTTITWSPVYNGRNYRVRFIHDLTTNDWQESGDTIEAHVGRNQFAVDRTVPCEHQRTLLPDRHTPPNVRIDHPLG